MKIEAPAPAYLSVVCSLNLKIGAKLEIHTVDKISYSIKQSTIQLLSSYWQNDGAALSNHITTTGRL
jgi:hypothetical protein